MRVRIEFTETVARSVWVDVDHVNDAAAALVAYRKSGDCAAVVEEWIDQSTDDDSSIDLTSFRFYPEKE